ncbi:MAG TPA: hypothetical protein VMM56_01835 [Planctomycetaceae bacterium]|nr:hypothetical protein [Planctomycetaceae bacterium]
MNNFNLPITDKNSVPVYDCHVILSPPDAEEHSYRAVVSNLPEVTAQGATERDCLHQIVSRFKAAIRACREEGRTIPWMEPKLEPKPGQQERWIPVHL